jgi:uncharacterized protein involved in exopolysaccharide biosynthesis
LQHPQNIDSAQAPQDDAEISLLDIVLFLKKTYKTILLFGLFGLVLAIIYILITPKIYEASAQIAMAQIGAANNNNNNNNLNPLGINIEEPVLLVSRMSLPTSFPTQTISACGFDGSSEPGAALAKSMKLSLVKGVPNIVELKTVGPSPEAALGCASAIFELIKTTQSQIVTPYIEEARIKLADDEARLDKARELVSRADKSGSTMSVAYLSTRDEIRYLLDEITSLKNVVTSNQNRITHLVAPIYASDQPISPKKFITLVAGLMSGLFLGVLIALVRQMIPKLKAQLQGGAL